MVVLHYYQLVADKPIIKESLKNLLGEKLSLLSSEVCYNVDVSVREEEFSTEDQKRLKWVLNLLSESKEVRQKDTFLSKKQENDHILEFGPRLNQKTPFCTNATSICANVGLRDITGIEISYRYLLRCSNFQNLEGKIHALLHDRMTQCRYSEPLETLCCSVNKSPWVEIDVIKGRSKALQVASSELGLAFDDWDIKFYANLFRHELRRNPTSVECFDLAQSNSEHSRHWFFKSQIEVEGVAKQLSLFEQVMSTLENSNKNNVIAFCDNGSAIEGYKVDQILPELPGKPSPFQRSSNTRHITLTAETHNFPTGIEPFSGAATGVGGRQRDQHAVGRGANIIAGTAGYCVGNLNLPRHALPWEDGGEWKKCGSIASAEKIIIEASNGASNYGNQFGEPLISGFFRSFGMIVGDRERREWLKPIMFSGGVGSISEKHVDKLKLESDTKGVLVAKIGGPAYRIGVGGGSASSLMHGENASSRDFDAVQRGDAEMQQKLNRAIRACIELGEKNPILSIHDQGAGGNGNVLKEIVEPSGAVIFSKAFTLGDQSLTSLELWTAEYQESDAVLVDKKGIATLTAICARERCPLDVVGELNGSGRIVLSEEDIDYSPPAKIPRAATDEKERHPVDLDLKLVLGKMPQKKYALVWSERELLEFASEKIVFQEALDRVLRLPAVASKRFLTNKVDRSVSGLVAQQQCVGPLHTPLADVAVTALSHLDSKGCATALGEQPIKMLVDEKRGARMAVGEALTNLVFASVSNLRDVKCSANWMWPAKLPGEGARMYNACEAMCDVMKEIGVAVDGGKDSLSMAASVEEEIVKAPGSLVISAYTPCDDISLVLTPDLECPHAGNPGALVYVSMSSSPPHLGGSALGQCYNQLGSKTPDLDDPSLFAKAWNVTQKLLKSGLVTSGHDVSDGGLIACVLEMAFAGNCGLKIDVSSCFRALEFWFSERLGLVLETLNEAEVLKEYRHAGVECVSLGNSIQERKITVSHNGSVIINGAATNELRDVWESTSFALDRLQCNQSSVSDERAWLLECDELPAYRLTFDPLPLLTSDAKVAIVREEGSNGDREMAAAFTEAGFQAWDVTMQDLLDGAVTLDRFRGVVFVGGFSFADVFGSAKGWAACCLFNHSLSAQLDHFRRRSDTFSLGVCNGCQLMALLGWIGESPKNEPSKKPVVHLAPNVSNRFESRFVSVKVEKSHSIMFDGMEGSVLGVWVAHGEGRFQFKEGADLDRVISSGEAPLRYVDHSGEITQRYPLNPNGSPQGLAGLCSADGRHLAVMPHPERCFKMWQMPWKPVSWKGRLQSPWMRMFQNALKWCKDL